MPNCILPTCEGKFVDLINTIAEMIKDWEITTHHYHRLLSQLSDLYKIIIHIHQNHLHGKKHNVSQQLDPGLKSGCSDLTALDRLLREIETQYDYDGNGLVYGDDFIFPELDPNIPKAIQETQLQLEAEFGRLQDQFMSVSDYLHFAGMDVNKSELIQYDPLPNAICQLITEKNPNAKNKHDLVYGKDYIVDINDKQKPKLLTDLEKSLDIDFNNIKMISWQEYIKDYIKPKDEELIIDDKSELSKKLSETCSYVSTRLVAEWLNMTDIDNNGLIYGIDFILADDQYFKSRCLKELESDVDWNPPDDIPILTWDQFCLTFPDKNPDDRFKKYEYY